jgi:hypothetical protein
MGCQPFLTEGELLILSNQKADPFYRKRLFCCGRPKDRMSEPYPQGFKGFESVPAGVRGIADLKF